MGRTPSAELARAFDAYNATRDRATRTGDWTILADCFTDDAVWIEHAMGEFQGRAAIEAFLREALAPFPHLAFAIDWSVLDEERGAVVLQQRQIFPDPPGWKGEPFSVAQWSRLVYAGDGRFASKEDVHNPARDLPRVLRAWREAGGRMEGAARVKGAS